MPAPETGQATQPPPKVAATMGLVATPKATIRETVVGAFAPTGTTEEATVTRIVDGDTIRVLIDGTDYPVRYIGMDTPEPDATDPTVRQFAIEATVANAALVEGRDVILERDVSETDQFDRLLRNVWVLDASGALVLVNLELIRQGYAQVSTFPPDIKYVDLLVEAQESTRSVARGLWAPAPTPETTPEPTQQPVFAIHQTEVTADAEIRAAFRGQVGNYTWSTVVFPELLAVVRWDVESTDNACTVTWWADSISGEIAVDAGGEAKGSKQFTTPFATAELVVDSDCNKWLITMQGVAPPPDPTPRPPSGGGGGNCHPSYEGACLKQGAGDYDCAAGSGNGPNYVAGPISVVGFDEFDLDRDGDGIGCQNG